MNNEDMSELFNKFSSMVNEGNIPDEMKNILSSLSNNNNGNDTKSSSSEESRQNNDNTSSIDMETMLKMKSIMDKMKNTGNDPRANLLMSLKPYLKDSRKDKVDQYIKMINMSKAFELFNNLGGENKK